MLFLSINLVNDKKKIERDTIYYMHILFKKIPHYLTRIEQICQIESFIMRRCI